MLLERVVNLVCKKEKMSTASNLVHHACWQHDDPSPVGFLYKNDNLDTYVPFVFHLSFNVELRYDEYTYFHSLHTLLSRFG